MGNRIVPHPPTVADDFQKGRWGSRSEAGGRRLRAIDLGGGPYTFDLSLVVESTDGSELKAPFYYHLHDSFPLDTYRITNVRHERYAIFEQINAYETFTAAVEVRGSNGDWLGLELDLEEVDAIPVRYKPPRLTLQRAGQDEQTVSGRQVVLERIITENRIITNPMEWRAAWVKAERWVCRICLGPKPLGTGVLVGRNVVLTNWHVVEHVINAPGSALNFEFDHLYGVRGELPRAFVRNAASDWLIDSGKYTEEEGSGTAPTVLPQPHELDFALIKLAPKEDLLGVRRGFATLPHHIQYESGAGLIILQHPRGNPQSFAVDFQGVIGLNSNETRLRYATNTQSGASGAPCFDLDWQFVALHHAGFDDWPNGGAYNQGIPISRLRAAIDVAVAAAG